MTSSSGRRAGAAWVVAAVCVGLLTGLAEVSVHLFRQLALGEVIHRSRHFVWMAPLTYAALFLPAGLALWAGLPALPERWRPRVGWFVLALAAAGSLLLLPLFRRIHPLALLVLGIGVAARMAHVAGARPDAWARRARALLPPAAAAVAVLAAVAFGLPAYMERQARAALPAAPEGAPNVLLIILDTVRSANLGLYGYDRPTTPRLERLAREGATFESAWSTSPWTLPSHASMFTGRYPHALSGDWLEPLGDAHPTLAEALRDEGWLTGGFVANRAYATYEHGLDRGFIRYEDYRVSPGQAVRSAGLGRRIADARSLRPLVGTDWQLGFKDARRLTDDVLRWTRNAGQRPWLAFVNYFDAHDPYLPPDEHFRAIAGHARPHRLSPFRRHPAGTLDERLTPEELRLERDSYDAAIAYVDAQVGRLLDSLERRGELDRTLVVIASDHGEEFGEHGVFFHGHSLYAPSLHVPLVMRYPPAVPAGVRVSRPVTLRDLPATVATLAGVESPRFPGRSLRHAWADAAPEAREGGVPGAEAPPATASAGPGGGGPDGSPILSEVSRGVRLPESYPVSRGDMASLLAGGRRYIRNEAGDEELYAWPGDRWEREDLWTDVGSDAMGRYRRALAAAREPGAGPSPIARGGGR